MTIEQDFDLILDQKVLAATQGKRFSRLLEKPKIARIFDEILNNLPQLYEPQLIWDIFPINKIIGNSFLLKNGIVIGGGPVIQVMKEASEIILGMCTVGIKFDKQLDEYRHSGNNLAVVILESIANFLVDQVRETFFKQTILKYTNEGKSFGSG